MLCLLPVLRATLSTRTVQLWLDRSTFRMQLMTVNIQLATQTRML